MSAITKPSDVFPECQPVLEVRNLSRRPLTRDVSMVVRAGEIVGLAGLVVGGSTGIAVLAKEGDLAERCPDRACPPAEHAAASSNVHDPSSKQHAPGCGQFAVAQSMLSPW